MAKPNYAFAKRQRDLAKKQKKEEKKLRKTSSPTEGGDVASDPADDTAGHGADLGADQARSPGNLAAEQASPLSGEAATSRQPGTA